jgi:hypothetical protein
LEAIARMHRKLIADDAAEASAAIGASTMRRRESAVFRNALQRAYT